MKRSIFFSAVLVAVMATACTKTPPQTPSETPAQTPPDTHAQTPVQTPLHIFLAKTDSPHQVGKYSDAEKLIRATPGEVGAVVFGPYVNLEPGRYSATFDVTATAPTSGVPLGAVDVNAVSAANPDNKPVITQSLNSLPSSQKPAVEFSVSSRDEKYEFRVWSSGVGVVEYRGVEVKAIN